MVDKTKALVFIKYKFTERHGINPPLGCYIQTPTLELEKEFSLSYYEVCELLVSLEKKGRIVLGGNHGRSLFLHETYPG